MRLEPAFIQGGVGLLHTTLFCSDSSADEALLILPPFAEEMNKCRPMMAAIARTACLKGINAWLFDLHGTGDSDGDFRDATWERWLDDVATLCAHVQSSGAKRVHVLCVRTGALLAESALRGIDPQSSHLILWQPVFKGADYWRQFLRLKVAATALRERGRENGLTPQQMLERDGEIEIAGYSVSSGLASGLSRAEFRADVLRRFRATTILECSQMEPPAVSGGTERALQKWRDANIEPASVVVKGEPFWATAEIAMAPALIDATVARLFEGRS